MKKCFYRLGAVVVFFFLFLPFILSYETASAVNFDTEGVWELKHLYSQKISIGTVRDLYPSTGEWSADMLITGIQFLNEYMAYLRCETPSGSQTADYEVFYSKKISASKVQITFTLRSKDEIVLFLFFSED